MAALSILWRLTRRVAVALLGTVKFVKHEMAAKRPKRMRRVFIVKV